MLEGWPGAAALFEENIIAAHQIYWHQRFLATFRSRGSSANNHVIAEAAGQLVASGAFPWFAESRRWQDDASRLLDDELAHNTFPSGLNREQAFDYHGLVAELGSRRGGRGRGRRCVARDGYLAAAGRHARRPRRGARLRRPSAPLRRR